MYEMIQYELMEETFVLAFMKLESSLRVSRNADQLEKTLRFLF